MQQNVVVTVPISRLRMGLALTLYFCSRLRQCQCPLALPCLWLIDAAGKLRIQHIIA